MAINKVILSGNLTREPELRYTNAGTAILAFGIAVNERVKNSQTGEWEDRPNFIDCNMWGKRAEAVSKYLAKGTKVCLEGRLRYNTWEKNGEKRAKVDVTVDEIELLSRSEAAGGSAPAQAGGYYQAPQSKPQQPSQPQYQQAQYQPQQQYQATNYAQQQYMAPQGFQQQSFDAASAVYDEDIPF